MRYNDILGKELKPFMLTFTREDDGTQHICGYCDSEAKALDAAKNHGGRVIFTDQVNGDREVTGIFRIYKMPDPIRYFRIDRSIKDIPKD